MSALPIFALPEPPRKRWSRMQFAEADAAGLFMAERLELIDGELISKMGKNRPHVYVLVRLFNLLQSIFGAGFVNPEAPLDVAAADNPSNEPQPDLIVLRENMETLSSNARPEDLHLVVEISDTTLRFDLSTKARLYARAAVPEYWVIDITGRRAIVHRNPVDGEWRSITIFGENESFSPLAAPTSELHGREFLPASS